MSPKTTAPTPQKNATNELLAGLHTDQKKAVTHTAGPLLIVAGAGTGKTTVLTKRIAWLIQNQNVKPEEILALTFTDRAAEEMETRVDRLLPMGYGELAVDTFHGFCDKLLTQEGLEIGLDTRYKLLSQADQWLFLRKHVFELPLNLYRPLGRPNAFLAELAKHLSRAKDEDISAEQYRAYAQKKKDEAKTDEEKAEAVRVLEIAALYEASQKLMAEEGLIDFGDLIAYSLKLLRERPAVRARIQKRYKYVLVDEFQDTNIAQMELVKLLASPQNNLTVVGDDAQAIYKFRGASVSNIIQFRRDYPNAEQIVLTQNYRSTQEILDLAYASIQFNNPDTLEFKEGISKKLVAEKKTGVPPERYHEQTAEREALAVVNEIIRLRNADPAGTWADSAILIRSNAQADTFVQLLSAREVPFAFRAARGLYTRPEILDILAYLRVLADPHDSVSLYRVLTLPAFNFPVHDIMLLSSEAKKAADSLFETLSGSGRIAGLSEDARKRIDSFLKLYESHARRAREEEAGAMVLAFLEETDMLKTLKAEDSPENLRRLQGITLFFKRLQEFGNAGVSHTVKEFITELDLLIEAGEDPSPVMQEDGPDVVQIMTIHGAKGLEFKNVFVTNLASDRFPTRRRSEALPLPDELVKEELPENDPHLLEERRLFYVALTRAQERLYLTDAEDYGGKRKKKPSRFLLEVRSVLEQWQQDREPTQQDLFAPASTVKGDAHNVPAGPEKPRRNKLPSRFSFSQLKVFETCPRQYEFAHILKIPGKGSHTFSYGKSIHTAMQRFYEGLQRGEEPTPERLVQLLEDNWVNAYYQSRAHAQARKEEAKESLRRYFERVQPTLHAPLFIEKGFNLKIGPYAFKGYIDRVDQADDGTVTIVDYKTGKPPTKQSDVDENLQLSLYALAVRDVLNLQPGRLALEFVDVGERWETERTPEELDAFREHVLETMAEMETSNFAPTPGFQCKFCDFQNICDAAQR